MSIKDVAPDDPTLALLWKAGAIHAVTLSLLETFMRKWHVMGHEAILETCIMQEPKLADYYSEYLGLERVYKLAAENVHIETLHRCSYEMLRRLRAVPYSMIADGARCKVMLDNPLCAETLDELGAHLKCKVVPVVGTRAQIDRAISRFYDPTLQFKNLLETL